MFMSKNESMKTPQQTNSPPKKCPSTLGTKLRLLPLLFPIYSLSPSKCLSDFPLSLHSHFSYYTIQPKLAELTPVPVAISSPYQYILLPTIYPAYYSQSTLSYSRILYYASVPCPASSITLPSSSLPLLSSCCAQECGFAAL